MITSELRLWITTIVFAFLLFLLMLGYSSLFEGILSLASLGRTLAATGGVLIGSSLGIGSFCYYFNLLDSKVGYRKYLGIVGYGFALLYCIFLVLVYPEQYGSGLFARFQEPEVILGMTAMSIFTLMFAVSNKTMMLALTPVRWRMILRTGLLAYGLLVVRAFMVDGAEWQRWFETLGTVPPPRLLLVVFAVSVIGLRLSVPVHHLLTGTKKTASHPPPNYTPLPARYTPVHRSGVRSD